VKPTMYSRKLKILTSRWKNELTKKRNLSAKYGVLIRAYNAQQQVIEQQKRIIEQLTMPKER